MCAIIKLLCLLFPSLESPSLSIHSSSSEDTDKSPKVKKSWAPFRRSGKTPEIQKRKLNKTKRLSGSMEDLDEVSVRAIKL